jgi:hypothetical protein
MGIKLIKEVVQGQSGSTSSQSAASQYTRVFKMLLDAPADINNVSAFDAVAQLDGGFNGIGTLHPLDQFSSCSAVSIAPDGDSRMVYTVTVSYSPSEAVALQNGGGNDNTPDPREQEPDLRPANWSTSTTTIEVPSWVWAPQWGPNAGKVTAVFNPAGDLVDGVTILQPIVNISVEQYCSGDQTVFSKAVGLVNSNQGQIGSLNLFPRSTLFRGVSFKPHAEKIGRKVWRGWLGTFEFSYKPNYNNYIAMSLNGGNIPPQPDPRAYIGWDIAIPLSGFNIINQFGQDVDKGACHLELENDATGAIKNWPNPAIAPGTDGEKMRANVLITTPTDGGTRASQRPSASPVPLNENGTPRDPKAPMNRGGPVLVRRYQVYGEFDMSTLGLRFR